MARPLKSTPLEMLATGGRLKTAMREKGYTAEKLANETGISMSTIYHYIHGRREMHLNEVRAIGAALKVAPGWITWGCMN